MHIRAFRRAWAAACVNAGLGHEVREPDVIEPDGIVHKGRLVRGVTRTPHDFRRTAAMRLSRAGVPEAVIIKLCGWKTPPSRIGGFTTPKSPFRLGKMWLMWRMWRAFRINSFPGFVPRFPLRGDLPLVEDQLGEPDSFHPIPRRRSVVDAQVTEQRRRPLESR